VHVIDLQAEAEEFPEGSAFARRFGHRTIAAVPLLREEVAVGAIVLRRPKVNPFTNRQITLLETFAAHEGKSLQHSLYIIGQAVLDNFEAISEIHLRMPDNYCLPVNLKPFGMENDNEVLAPVEEPRGVANAMLRRSKLV